MNLVTLKELILQKESHNLEFKKSTSQLHNAFEALCAFLNGYGGTVLIGVKDDGEIVGQEISDKTKQEIANEISRIEPSIHPDVHYIQWKADKYVIALKVAPGKHIPYVYDGRPFSREQSVTKKMTQHRYEQLLIERGQLNHSWEEQKAFQNDLDLLDKDEIYKMIQQGVQVNRIPPEALNEPIEIILKRLKLIKEGKLTKAAFVLFSKEVFPDYAECLIKMARFKGMDKLGEFIDNQQVYGNAFKLLTEANYFLQRHLSIASSFKPGQLERIDTPTLPALAVREALINAICHRDYQDSSAPIFLAIYDDRMEIWNNGTLPLKLNLEDLKGSHPSLPRNKIIAEVFYNRGFIEKWGTGTTKMINLCRENNTPDPIFSEYGGGFSIIFKFKEPIITERKASLNVTAHSIELSPRQKEIMEIFKNSQEKKLSLRDISSQLKNPAALRTIRDDIASLKEKGYLSLEGTGRGAKWLLSSKK